MRENLTYGLMRGRWKRGYGPPSLGHEGGNAGHRQGGPCGPPRQRSTLQTRNVLGKIRKVDWEEAKRDLHRISHARNRASARKAARSFAERWGASYPKALACLRDDLEELLTFFRYDDPEWRKATRTTNAIERRFVEVRRRTRPMGVFSDRTSMERILFAVFSYENQKEGTAPLFLLTQNS
jgi:putative transposase